MRNRWPAKSLGLTGSFTRSKNNVNVQVAIQKKLIKRERKRNLEARASRPNPRHLRGLRNLNLGMDLPYNLHTLQLATMQEKC